MKKTTFKKIAAIAITLLALALVGLGFYSCINSKSWTLSTTTEKETNIYKGEAVVHGYLNLNIFEKELQFKIIEEDLEKLPEQKYPYYLLYEESGSKKLSKDIMAKLKKATKANPAAVSTDEVKYPMEGTPWMHVKAVE